MTCKELEVEWIEKHYPNTLKPSVKSYQDVIFSRCYWIGWPRTPQPTKGLSSKVNLWEGA